MTETILITGASGNLGKKLSAGLKNRFDLRLLDLRGGENVESADLTSTDDCWLHLFSGVDTVVHLAGEPKPNAPWDKCYQSNVVGTRNVLAAARKACVKRVILASTNQIMAGYRFLEDPVFSDGEPKPLNPYAVSKLICEEMGKSFAADTGISFIALRIGYVLDGNDHPKPAMGIGLWGQQMWLSDGDLVRGFERAVLAQDVPIAVLNLVSDNAGMRWDMEKTKEVIGFTPQDSYSPMLAPEDQQEDNRAKLARLTPGSWLDQFFNPME
jgi:NAD+ dependent glucose-6-phosphate dehydrogenase